MQITLIFLDKHSETLPLKEAKIKCKLECGVIMDAETDNRAIQNKLREIIDFDVWLFEKQRGVKSEISSG